MDEQDTKAQLLRADLDATNMVRQAIYSQQQFEIRSLQVLNGGGSVAILAFLGQTWNEVVELRLALVLTVAGMIVGLCFAVWGSRILPTYTEQSFRQHESNEAAVRAKKIKRQYRRILGSSFSAFIISVIWLLVYLSFVTLKILFSCHDTL